MKRVRMDLGGSLDQPKSPARTESMKIRRQRSGYNIHTSDVEVGAAAAKPGFCASVFTCSPCCKKADGDAGGKPKREHDDIKQYDIETSDVEAMTNTETSGGGGGEPSASDYAGVVGLDEEDLNSELEQYADDLNGFVDVLPSLLLSVLELVAIFIVMAFRELIVFVCNVFLVMQGNISSARQYSLRALTKQKRIHLFCLNRIGWLGRL